MLDVGRKNLQSIPSGEEDGRVKAGVSKEQGVEQREGNSAVSLHRQIPGGEEEGEIL
jgi:hypothetical protein